ncbi:MAG: hypothetical protein PHX51_07220 [Clostridia bacterium]|nr:hypothetical protein [Clostridia bacterium]
MKKIVVLLLYCSIAFGQGIWTKDVSEDNLRALYKEGFRSVHFNLEHFYKGDSIYFTEMVQRYEFAKRLGYKQFLIGADWGLFEEVSTWKRIINLFGDKADVVLYSGEPYLNLAKCCSMTDVEIDSLIRLRKTYSDKYVFDEVFRNYEKLTQIVDSSRCAFSEYPFQEEHWHSKVPFVWIYGNSNWHTWLNWITNTVDYEYLKQEADKFGIKDFWLYQGDSDNFFIKIQEFFGVRERAEKEKRKDYLKVFYNRN